MEAVAATTLHWFALTVVVVVVVVVVVSDVTLSEERKNHEWMNGWLQSVSQ